MLYIVRPMNMPIIGQPTCQCVVSFTKRHGPSLSMGMLLVSPIMAFPPPRHCILLYGFFIRDHLHSTHPLSSMRVRCSNAGSLGGPCRAGGSSGARGGRWGVVYRWSGRPGVAADGSDGGIDGGGSSHGLRPKLSWPLREPSTPFSRFFRP